MAARDYKHSAARNGKPPVAPGSWVSFISGLGLGLLVALAVYLWALEAAPPAADPAGIEATPEPSAAGVPAASEDELADALEPPRPKFDFYKILPEMEVPVQEWELAEQTPATVAEPSGAFLLQVGSYKQFEDADQAKAKLALQGITATIQRVVINGQDVWFRVHVGPFAASESLRAMRLRLIDSDTDFIVLKIGGGGPP